MYLSTCKPDPFHLWLTQVSVSQLQVLSEELDCRETVMPHQEGARLQEGVTQQLSCAFLLTTQR